VSRRAPGSVVAIGLVACAALLYEVTITRVLSVVLWYHFAFLSLSVAMLGLGAPGVWFSLRPPRARSLRLALLAAAAGLPMSVIAVLHAGAWLPGAAPLVIVFAMLAPMLALGSAICLLLLEAPGRRVGRVYGADLLGAMLGALVAVPLMWALPAPRIIALSALLPLLAAVATGARGTALAGLCLVLPVLVAGGPLLEVSANKQYSERERPPVYERWTPTARITVFDRPIYRTDPELPWGWGMGTRWDPRPAAQMWIDQDGSAGTPIERAGEGEPLAHLPFDVTSVGYQLVRPRSVCIIGAGGGRDVLTALASGAERVEAVELNRAIVEALSGPFARFSGDVYHRPGVRPIVAEGRSHLTRSEERYDLLQISLVDSFTASAAGAYALSESFLYTIEAFQLYWSRITDLGLVSVSRFAGGPQQLESVRLALLAVAALESLGVEEPRRHLAFVEAGGVGTLLLARRPFDAAAIEQLDEIAAERGFRRLWPPPPSTDPRSHVLRALVEGPARYEEAGFDLSPPSDDRPFFFQTVSILAAPDAETLASLGTNEESVVLLRRLVEILGVLALLLFFSPFALERRLARAPGLWRGSAYFAAIGLGFMLVEIPLIQRVILFLGHPSYATSVVLAFLLLGAGVGSVLAGRLPFERVQRARWALPLGVAVAYGLGSALFDASLGQPIEVRVSLCLLVLAPTGGLMGFAFPSGMLRFGDAHKAWFWAVNAAFGVLASALSLALAMGMGFSRVVALGVVAYLVAAWLLAGAPAAARQPAAG
jgi:hypothetical protein